MSDYIDPRVEPWGDDTGEIWEWMKATWEANVAVVYVPNTEANRINEYRQITQFWRQRYQQKNRGYTASLSQLTSWLYDQKKVNQPDNRPHPPRSRQQRPFDPLADFKY